MTTDIAQSVTWIAKFDDLEWMRMNTHCRQILSTPKRWYLNSAVLILSLHTGTARGRLSAVWHFQQHKSRLSSLELYLEIILSSNPTHSQGMQISLLQSMNDIVRLASAITICDHGQVWIFKTTCWA